MITVKVTYAIKETFLERNKENIYAFIKDFKVLDGKYFRYEVYMLDDHSTFVHISTYADEQIQKEVLNTPSFVAFQKQRDESGLIKPHRVEILNLLATSVGG